MGSKYNSKYQDISIDCIFFSVEFSKDELLEQNQALSEELAQCQVY